MGLGLRLIDDRDWESRRRCGVIGMRSVRQ